MSNIIHAKEIHEGAAWQDLTPGLQIYESATSKEFETGEWRVNTPVYCPDSAIPVSGGERGEFDLKHCKGCGICVKACPFDAITMKEGK